MGRSEIVRKDRVMINITERLDESLPVISEATTFTVGFGLSVVAVDIPVPLILVEQFSREI